MKKEFDWFDKHENVNLVRRVSYGLLAATIVAELVVRFLLHVHPGEHSWDVIPGFYALFGFIVCALLIVLSKFLGHYWLKKDERYYG